MVEHRLVLPWATPPLSLNQRLGHHAKARKVAEVRRTSAWLARAAGVGSHELVRVTLVYTPATRRIRDSDNLVASYKPLVDGLVDAGVVPDDDDSHVERVWPLLLTPDRAAAGLVLLVKPLR